MRADCLPLRALAEDNPIFSPPLTLENTVQSDGLVSLSALAAMDGDSKPSLTKRFSSARDEAQQIKTPTPPIKSWRIEIIGLVFFASGTERTFPPQPAGSRPARERTRSCHRTPSH